jgi:hypothetical protein
LHAGDESSNKTDPADTLPPASTVAVTQVGDLWLLDKHRLFCGNALDEASYRHLMHDQ